MFPIQTSYSQFIPMMGSVILDVSTDEIPILKTPNVTRYFQACLEICPPTFNSVIYRHYFRTLLFQYGVHPRNIAFTDRPLIIDLIPTTSVKHCAVSKLFK